MFLESDSHETFWSSRVAYARARAGAAEYCDSGPDVAPRPAAFLSVSAMFPGLLASI